MYLPLRPPNFFIHLCRSLVYSVCLGSTETRGQSHRDVMEDAVGFLRGYSSQQRAFKNGSVSKPVEGYLENYYNPLLNR